MNFKFFNEGYESISATGVSLGGLMTLKLAQHYPLKRIAVMSAPKEKSDDGLIEHLVYLVNACRIF